MQRSNKSIEVIAYETANGIYGTGKERERNLRSLGYNPVRIQKLVNRYMKYGFPLGIENKAARYHQQNVLGDSYTVDDLIYIIKKKGNSIKDDVLDSLKNRIERSINDGKTNLSNLMSYLESKVDSLSVEDLYKLLEKDMGDSDSKDDDNTGFEDIEYEEDLSDEELQRLIQKAKDPKTIEDVVNKLTSMPITSPDLIGQVIMNFPSAEAKGITTVKKLSNIVDYCLEHDYTSDEILQVLYNEVRGKPTKEGPMAEEWAKKKDTDGDGIPDSTEDLNKAIEETDEVPVPEGSVVGSAGGEPVSTAPSYSPGYSGGTNNPSPNNLITCYIRNMITDEVIKFPTIPTDLSESYQTNYSSTDINGRSAPYQTYGGNGSRSLNYNVHLYEDLCSGEYGSLGDIVRKLKSLVYPRYNGSIVIPPYCFLKFGDMVTCYAIMESINFAWGEVILEGKGNFASCEVDFSFQELRIDKIPTADTVFPDREG